jgi:hypothetical protein
VDAIALLNLVEALLSLVRLLPGGNVGEELSQVRDEDLNLADPWPVPEDEHLAAVTAVGGKDGGSIAAEGDTLVVVVVEGLLNRVVGGDPVEGDDSIENQVAGWEQIGWRKLFGNSPEVCAEVEEGRELALNEAARLPLLPGDCDAELGFEIGPVKGPLQPKREVFHGVPSCWCCYVADTMRRGAAWYSACPE